MRKRLLSVLLVVIITFSACGQSNGEAVPVEKMSKKELLQQYYSLLDLYSSLQQEKNNIESLYNALNVDSTPTAAIGYVGDGTGALSFNSRDSKIIFPDTFGYPGAAQTKANNRVYITDGVYVMPGTNWVIKLNGTTLEMEHSNGISGIIKIGDVGVIFGADQLRDEVLAPWFNGISGANVSYSDLFSSNSSSAIGVDAYLPIMIDKEDATLRCGMASIGTRAVTYIFVYRNDPMNPQQDVSRDESIVSVINSIVVDGDNLKVNL